MTKQYLKAIFLSFYSNDIYGSVLRNWYGFGLKYLFFVTLISSTFLAMGWVWNIGKISSESLAENVTGFIISKPDLSFEENINRFINIVSQVPEITFVDNSAKVEVPQPYSITDPISDTDVAIIDTTGKVKSLEGTEALLLLTDSKLIVKNKTGQEDVVYIRDFQKRYNTDEKSLNEVMYIISQVPPFGLHAGKFVTEGDKLYQILDKKNGSLLAEIGPGAQHAETIPPVIAISQLEINYKNIFNRKTVAIKASEFNEQTLFSAVKSVAVFVKKIVLWGVPLVAWPFILLTSFIFNAIMLSFYAFIGHSFIKMKKLGEFKYKDIMRISAIAITPMVLASAIFPHVVAGQGTLFFLLSLLYLYFAIKHITVRS